MSGRGFFYLLLILGLLVAAGMGAACQAGLVACTVGVGGAERK